MKQLCPICQKPVNNTKQGKDSIICPAELDFKTTHLACWLKRGIIKADKEKPDHQKLNIGRDKR